MTDARDGIVECGEHGPESATFVCRHLAASRKTGERVGFLASDNPLVARPDAWCTACEIKRLEYGGDWCDESEAFAGITLICASCYDDIRSLNAEDAANG